MMSAGYLPDLDVLNGVLIRFISEVLTAALSQGLFTVRWRFVSDDGEFLVGRDVRLPVAVAIAIGRLTHGGQVNDLVLTHLLVTVVIIAGYWPFGCSCDRSGRCKTFPFIK